MRQGKVATALIQILLIVLGTLLIWRIVAVGMAQFTIANSTHSLEQAQRSLSWYSTQSKALKQAGIALSDINQKQAEQYLRQAYNSDPTDGNTMISLAYLWLNQSHTAQADQAARLAFQLEPTNIGINQSAINYWIMRKNPGAVIQLIDRQLQMQPYRERKLFPILLSYAGSPAGIAGLKAVNAPLSNWWTTFFLYAVKNSGQINVVSHLYRLQLNSDRPLTDQQLEAYLQRLHRDHRINEAYRVWSSTLSPTESRFRRALYDGGFEQTRLRGGFDWSIIDQPGVDVTVNKEAANRGKNGLSIAFNNLPVKGTIIQQILILKPGTYQFKGQVRTNRLLMEEGLEWALYCDYSNDKKLASSEPLIASPQWSHFSFQFTVPAEQCRLQRLSLQPAGTGQHNAHPSGNANFDQLIIGTIF